MADQSFREIQLSGKQLVFLFMASVVLAVAIFPLGISVGRGVRGPSSDSAPVDAAVAPSGQMTPAEMPPKTEPMPADLSYHDQLQGQTPPAAQPVTQTAPASTSASPADPPVPADEDAAPASRASAADASKPQAAAATAAPKTPAPAPARTAEKADTPPAPAAGGWVVQVNAFRSKDNADRQVAQLKAKGYAAFAAASAPGSLYHVRIGPFSQRADADRTAARLQREEGLTPLVIR
jgi:DedD protein